MSKQTCNKCGEPKPLTTEFYNLRSSGLWRGTCKQCMAANSRKHHYANPEMTAKRRERYKANLQMAVGSHTEVDIEKLREKQNDLCFYCKLFLGRGGEVDHKTPISKGGSNGPRNLVLACRTCNRDKHNKTAPEFIRWLKKRCEILN